MVSRSARVVSRSARVSSSCVLPGTILTCGGSGHVGFVGSSMFAGKSLSACRYATHSSQFSRVISLTWVQSVVLKR